MAKECMLTTMDNPHDYFKDFSSWLMFDIEKKYDTCGYLGRVVQLTDDMTQKEENEEVERAIDEIIEFDFLGIYKKVYREDGEETQNEAENDEKMQDKNELTTDSDTDE